MSKILVVGRVVDRMMRIHESYDRGYSCRRGLLKPTEIRPAYRVGFVDLHLWLYQILLSPSYPALAETSLARSEAASGYDFLCAAL